MQFKIKPEYLEQIKKKYNSVSLRKVMSADAAQKILNGEGNISMKNFYKLCKLMDWQFPDIFEVGEE